MHTLKIAIIGSGQIARISHIGNYRSMDGVEVAAVCDVNLQAAKALAEEFGIPAYYDDHITMLEEIRPDAVSVCVPNRFHCQITCDALDRGCHVLCEKPPSITLEEAVRMRDTAKAHGKILTYDFHFRHAERIALLKEKISRGDFGKIYAGEVEWVRRRGIPGWGNFTNKQMQGGGPLIDIGAHMLDVALYLLDYPRISYICAAWSDRIGKEGGTGLMGPWDGKNYTIEDSLFGFIQFADGGALQLKTAFALNIKEKDRRNVQLYGEKRGCSVFPLEIYGEEDGRQINVQYPFEETRDWHGDAIRDFVESIRENREPLVTADQSVYLQELLVSLYKAAQSGRPVFYGEM